jgi:hypothetical protein
VVAHGRNSCACEDTCRCKDVTEVGEVLIHRHLREMTRTRRKKNFLSPPLKASCFVDRVLEKVAYGYSLQIISFLLLQHPFNMVKIRYYPCLLFATTLFFSLIFKIKIYLLYRSGFIVIISNRLILYID